MSRRIRYSAGSDDGQSISFKKEESIFNGIDVTIKISYVVIFIIILLLSIKIVSFYRSMQTMERNCFVFDNSSERLLSEEEIMELRYEEKYEFKKLLRFSIDEIYARHGQIFKKGGEMAQFYEEYQWYRDTEKHDVHWNEFNEVEKSNLRLLISIEERYGYR